MSDVRIENIDRLPFDEYYNLVSIEINVYGNILTLRALIHHRTNEIEFAEVVKGDV